MKLLRSTTIITALFFLLTLPVCAGAADLLVAQAANFMPAMKEIIPAFEQKTGLKVQATYTSTGKLYAQIVNGAPFDLFLAADQKRPDKLFASGLAEKPFIYAKGKVVFWSLSKKIADKSWQDAVKSKKLHKIAIANVETAPYGTAAMEALKTEGLWDEIQPELVFAQSIAQVFQFASTGAADAGFCAYSSMFTPVGKTGVFTVVKEAPPVIQAACILKSTEHAMNAQKFVEFLSSPEAVTIKKKYGYD